MAAEHALLRGRAVLRERRSRGRRRARRQRRRAGDDLAALRRRDTDARGAEPGLARGAARLGRLRQHRRRPRTTASTSSCSACARSGPSTSRTRRFSGDCRSSPGTARFVATALQESTLVRVRGAVPSPRPDRTFRAGARHPIGYVDSNPDGDDGAPLTDYDLIGSAERGTGLFALRGSRTSHFLCMPPPARDRDVGPSVLVVASQLCRELRAMLVVDPPAAWGNSDEALHGPARACRSRRNTRSCASRACWPTTGCAAATRSFANCGAVAGALARMDAYRSPWRRGTRRGILLRPGTRPVRMLTDVERQRLTRTASTRCRSLRAANPRPLPIAHARAGPRLRARQHAAHGAPAHCCIDEQPRARHALGALRRRAIATAWPRLTRQSARVPARPAGERPVRGAPDAARGRQRRLRRAAQYAEHDLAEGHRQLLVRCRRARRRVSARSWSRTAATAARARGARSHRLPGRHERAAVPRGVPPARGDHPRRWQRRASPATHAGAGSSRSVRRELDAPRPSMPRRAASGVNQLPESTAARRLDLRLRRPVLPRLRRSRPASLSARQRAARD